VPTTGSRAGDHAAAGIRADDDYAEGMPESEASGLTILGSSIRGPVEHVESFPAPQAVTKVRFSTSEVTSLCPVTGQPDISSVVIEYEPGQRCIESKSLKL
jgi:NADPH-dependent 7-cyano-7-deazaguanine reductase QueF